MQNKRYWGKIKDFIGKNLNKKRYFAVLAFVLIHGLVAVLGISGIARLFDGNKGSEVIVLPGPKEPDEVFTQSYIGSIAEKKAEGEEKKEETSEKEVIKQELAQNKEAEAVTVFNEEKKEEFTPEFWQEVYILNDYTGLKLIKSKTMDDWRVHRGIDIKAEKNSAVCVVDAGTVLKVYTDDLFGKTVVISHAEGFSSIYSNLDEKVDLKEGDMVKKGQEIGKTGDTALCEKKEAPHLHFELLKDGEQVNPKEYIKY